MGGIQVNTVKFFQLCGVLKFFHKFGRKKNFFLIEACDLKTLLQSVVCKGGVTRSYALSGSWRRGRACLA